MPKKRGRSKGSGRVYWRKRGGEKRAYGDFRDFADVGGGREALIPKDGKRATTDSDVAESLATDRVKELEKARRNKTILGLERTAGLEDFADYHLEQKARTGKVTERHLEDLEGRLRSAVDFFGEDRALDTISVRDVEAWMHDLAKRPNGRGGTFSAGTVRHYLNSLSNLYTRAIGEQVVPPGYNPVAAVMDKPSGSKRSEARWLEAHDVALLLEAARLHGRTKPKRPKRGKYRATPNIYPILAAFALTGGRKSEVLGLAVDDVSFDRRTVTFRPNEHRRLKTRSAHRTVPLWPQLEAILRAHVFDREAPMPDGLLFPGVEGEMVGDLDKQLDTIAERAGWKAGEIRSKMLRHSYTAARLQTLDNGAPVSPFTVSRELGHGGRQMVERVYGHLGDVRHRAEVVEYRVEDHQERLGKRLDAVRGAE